MLEQSFAQALDGTQLYVRRIRAPRGPLCLLCDGLLCEGYIYRYLWDELAARGAVAHWNYREHGRSERARDEKRVLVTDFADDLDVVRKHLDDPPVVIFGHSFGFQVALEAYRRRPEKILGLVSLCGTVGHVTRTFRGSDWLATALPALRDAVQRHPRMSRALWGHLPALTVSRLARASGEVHKSLAAEDLVPYFEHLANLRPEVLVEMLTSAGEHTAEDVLPRVRVPVLAIAGDRDTFTPVNLAEKMAKTLPNCQLEVIPDGTHAVPLEEPQRIRQKVDDFLAELSRGPGDSRGD